MQRMQWILDCELAYEGGIDSLGDEIKSAINTLNNRELEVERNKMEYNDLNTPIVNIHHHKARQKQTIREKVSWEATIASSVAKSVKFGGNTKKKHIESQIIVSNGKIDTSSTISTNEATENPNSNWVKSPIAASQMSEDNLKSRYAITDEGSYLESQASIGNILPMAIDIQEFYELTLLDDTKSVQEKTAETIRIANKWEANDGPIAATYTNDRVCLYLVALRETQAYLSEPEGLVGDNSSGNSRTHYAIILTAT
ncbi:hypothetical protein Trydic_g4923 [Trypoxylus dichotomus]